MLTLSCPDRPGIVHDVSGFLAKRGGNILESQQFGDRLTGRFFMRIDFEIPGPAHRRRAQGRVRAGGRDVRMEYELWAAAAPYRTLIMVSKQLHCLNDLLFRWSTGSLQIEIPAVVSNHPDAEQLCDVYGLPFHHIPVTPDTKAEAEAQLLALINENDVHAGGARALHAGALRRPVPQLAGRIINIHHSFLPSFKGAKPYHQAYERGVKLVGATAHYVTADLDEGPIIEQDIVRVDHSYNQDQLVAAGRDVEAQVLSRAVRWHSESRVLLNGHRTVVFR